MKEGGDSPSGTLSPHCKGWPAGLTMDEGKKGSSVTAGDNVVDRGGGGQ